MAHIPIDLGDEYVNQIYYVYELVNRYTYVPFYIGKGKNYRCSTHIQRAKKTDKKNPLLEEIRRLDFERGVEINFLKKNISESEALELEVKLIEKIGRKDLGTGPLLNQTSGGDGISGGIDKYGYRHIGIARFITDLVDDGTFIEDVPDLVRQYVAENNMRVKYVEDRIIPHIQEMGNAGRHYKGKKITLQGWQFSLDGKMIDVNDLTMQTKGFLKAHGDLPLNEGFVAKAPEGYDFGY